MSQADPSPIIIRFSDPGLHPTKVTISCGIEIDKELATAMALGYTQACMTIECKDYWLYRFLGSKTWLPSVVFTAMRPYFSPEDV